MDGIDVFVCEEIWLSLWDDPTRETGTDLNESVLLYVWGNISGFDKDLFN